MCRSWKCSPPSIATALAGRVSALAAALSPPSHRKSHFYAGIIGLGCTIGIRKMMRISRDQRIRIENTVNWYFSPDGPRQPTTSPPSHGSHGTPNSRVGLRIVLHTSSDGQKFEVHVESLNANHSFKYFGKGKGVSVYSFIDERDLLFHSIVFSAAERESAYVIDGLMHNDVVKSDIHSTDTSATVR